jgi:DNA-binding PadR family transcriptional regulator
VDRAASLEDRTLPLAAAAYRLTDDEGTFLALLVRVQPATAYQLSKIYADSPVSNIGTSKGKIYPLVERLETRGLLKKRPVKGDARGSEWLECTARGEAAVRAWVLDIRPNHILLEDPLRTKLQSFDLLSRDEQLEWIVEAKSDLQNKLDELEAYAAEVTVPFKELVHDNAVSSVRCRMDWLDRVLAAIVRSKEPKDDAA